MLSSRHIRRSLRERSAPALFSAVLLGAIGFGAVAGSQGIPPAPQELVAYGFGDIQDALNQRLSIGQYRKFLGPDGNWTTVPEKLEIGPSDSPVEPNFLLSFDERAAIHLSVDVVTTLRRNYERYASSIHRYASFRIEDAEAAARNYVIVYLDTGARIGRTVHRIAILPRVMGRHAWLLELDVATGYPLVQARFNAAGRLVSTVEVASIATDGPAKVDWWTPRFSTSRFPSIEAATSGIAQFGLAAQFTWPTHSDIPSGFSLQEVRVVQHDLRPRVTIVATYTDGIDTMSVLESVGSSTPSQPRSDPASDEVPYAIYTNDDGAFAQYWFFQNGIEHIVVGSTGNLQLPELTQNILERSLR